MNGVFVMREDQGDVEVSGEITVLTIGRGHFAQVVTPDGRRFHFGPWRTLWAANKCADILSTGRYRLTLAPSKLVFRANATAPRRRRARVRLRG